MCYNSVLLYIQTKFELKILTSQSAFSTAEPDPLTWCSAFPEWAPLGHEL